MVENEENSGSDQARKWFILYVFSCVQEEFAPIVMVRSLKTIGSHPLDTVNIHNTFQNPGIQTFT